jgi:1-acyl-sn-glycerol-3-phosphate acyltransferase
MWKYIGWVIKVVPRVIFDYFAWIRRYARRPERYPLEVRYAKVRAFCLRLCRKLGVKVNFVNRPIQDRSEVRYYICNHVGFFDPIVLIAASREPIFFVAKKESKKMPFVGNSKMH